MIDQSKPLYMNTIDEYKTLLRTLIDDALKAREHKSPSQEADNKEAEHFTIKQLRDFLSCSKQSIHNYKKAGLPFYRIGRKILFKKKTVLYFMKTIRTKRVINRENDFFNSS